MYLKYNRLKKVKKVEKNKNSEQSHLQLPQTVNLKCYEQNISKMQWGIFVEQNSTFGLQMDCYFTDITVRISNQFQRV